MCREQEEREKSRTKQNNPKQIYLDISAHENLKYKSRGLMTENKSSLKQFEKMGKKEYSEKYICFFFTIWNAINQFILPSPNTTVILIFFHVPLTILLKVYFYTVRSMFSFLFSQSRLNAGVPNSNKSSLVYVEGQPSVS